MPGGHDTTIEVSNIMSFVLYTQILKQSVLKPASPGITLTMNEIEQKGQMLDQEKVTRVDFSLYAVRNTCIVSPTYGTYHGNLNQEKKIYQGLDEFAFVRWVAPVRAVNNLHA